MKHILLTLAILLTLMGCTNKEKKFTPTGPKVRAVVKFVEEGAELIREEGIAAFDKFRSDETWLREDKYIFVWGMDGMRYVYPPDPAGEGKIMLDLVDDDETPIGLQFVKIAQQSGGWVHYRWPKPGDTKPVWKSTYILPVKAPNGSEYLIGSGVYGIK